MRPIKLKPWQRWTIAALLVVLVLGPILWLMSASVELFLDSQDNGERAAALQAVAALATLVASVLLVGVTAQYTRLTGQLVRHAGPIVNAELQMAWVHHTGGGAIAGPFEAFKNGTQDPAYTRPYLAIVLRNTGNAASRIESVAVESETGFSVKQPIPEVGESCPLDLAGHSSVTLYVSLPLVASGIEAWEQTMGSASRRIRAQALLASGESARSDWQTFPHRPQH